MRMLFCTTANDGHFGPLLVLARAAVAAGHTVRVAAPQSFAATVAGVGLPHVPFDDAPQELVGPVMGRLPTLSFDEANETVVREVFGRIDAQAALPLVREAVEAWRPDVVVREPAELGSLAAAVSAGVPHLQVTIGMTEMTRMLAALLPEPLTELARVAMLPPDSLIDAVASEPLLSSVPESLDRAGDHTYVEDSVAFRFRDEPPTRSHTPLPAWGDPAMPLVYVTFGSVTGSLPPFARVFRDALDGLADLPIRVFMTVGRRVDIAGLGPVPANARVEAWWPQSDVLADAALVLGHGGYGTTMGAVSAGVPQVVAPIFTSDQVINSRHVASAGIGRSMTPGPDVVARACREVPAVLADARYTENARSVAAQVGSLPSSEEAITTIEQYVDAHG